MILVSSKAAEFKALQRACASCRLGVKSLFGLEGKQKQKERKTSHITNLN